MKQVDRAFREKEIHESLRHPFIVNLFGCFNDPRYIYLVLEYVVGGEMFTILRKAGRFENNQSQFYASQITVIFEYCHSKNIMYRALKPENILIHADGYLKLTDFGNAKVIEDRTFSLTVGFQYVAPEMLLNKGHGKPVDWWCLGVLVYEMIVGYPPFVDDDPMTIFQKMLSGKIVFPKLFDRGAKGLVKKLLTADPEKRYGVEGVKQHKWFHLLDWNLLLEKQLPVPFKPPVKGEEDTSMFDDFPDSDDERHIAVAADQDPLGWFGAPSR